MPNYGQVNNPGGVNNFNKFAPEPPYGQKIKVDRLTSEAPIASPSAVEAPRRAKRAATRRSASAAQTTSPQAPEDYQAAVADVLVQLASIPGASPLLQDYAARAVAQVNLGAR